MMRSFVAVLACSVALAAILSNWISRKHDLSKISQDVESVNCNATPKYWFYRSKGTGFHHLQSIERVLNKMGLQKIELNTSTSESILSTDWDLLWSYTAFSQSLPLNFSQLKVYQRLNHVPGNADLVSKSLLSTKYASKYIPRGFNNPDELFEYAKKHPEKRFVEKLYSNRGVSLKHPSEMEFIKNGNASYFAQEFIENPYLLDGHKFDLNIFVAITSVNPLRVYYYEKNSHLRVCPEPYDASDPENVDSYVIHTDHIPGYDFPPIKKYFEKSYTFKEALNLYFIHNGHDPVIIWDQIEGCIHSTLMAIEPQMINRINSLNASHGKHHFFELVRFDFLLDDELHLHLMEVNMSPNLFASRRIFHNQHLFENVIYNFFNLVGVGSYFKREHFSKSLEDLSIMAHENSLTVKPEVCLSSPCNETCEPISCELCWHCMTSDFKYDLQMAYLEHVNIGDFKRVVPPPYADLLNTNEKYWSELSANNELYSKWLIEMCKKNIRFC